MSILQDHFYHRTISLYTAVFGSVFNDLKIKRANNNIVEVPIQYSYQDKSNNRNTENPQPNGVKIKKTYPRMAFLLTDIVRDDARVKNKNNRLSNYGNVGTTDNVVTQYNRVPFNFLYELRIESKYIDDYLQIIEQIMVNFNPSIHIDVKDNPDIEGNSSINLSMTGSSLTQTYEGEYSESEVLEAVFNFELQGYLYQPSIQSEGIIKKVILNYRDLETFNVIETDIITPDEGDERL